MTNESFPGVKWPGHGFNHTPPTSTEAKERVYLNFYSPPGPSWSVLGGDLPYTPNMHPNLSENLQNLIQNFFLEHIGKDYFPFELHDTFDCCPVGRYNYESLEF